MPNFVTNLNKLMDMRGVISKESGSNRFTEEQLDIFIDQYYRNHLGNRKLVPEVKTLTSEELVRDGTIIDSIEIKADRNTYSDLYTTNGTLLPYVGVNINGVIEYFKIKADTIDADSKIIMTISHVKPLGIRNNFLEYDFNNEFLDSELRMEKGEVNNREEYNPPHVDASKSQSAYQYEYSPESTYQQEMPAEIMEHFEQAFESLTEDDMPAFARDYRQVDNDISNFLDYSDAANALIEEVGRDKIDEYRNECE